MGFVVPQKLRFGGFPITGSHPPFRLSQRQSFAIATLAVSTAASTWQIPDMLVKAQKCGEPMHVHPILRE